MNRKTALITAGAVAATLMVGTGAIAANIAVLNAADDDSIGDLSAEMPVASPPLEPQVIDVYVEDPAPATSPTTAETTAAPTPDSQEYTVEDAGSVTLTTADAALFVGSVVANPEWQWTSEQTSPSEVHVSFVNAATDTTYEFFATLADDGTIDVRVDQPVTRVVKVPSPDAGGGDSDAGSAQTPADPAATPAPTNAAADDGYEEDDVDDDYEDDDDEEDDEDDDYEDDDGDDDDGEDEADDYEDDEGEDDDYEEEQDDDEDHGESEDHEDEEDEDDD